MGSLGSLVSQRTSSLNAFSFNLLAYLSPFGDVKSVMCSKALQARRFNSNLNQLRERAREGTLLRLMCNFLMSTCDSLLMRLPYA